LAVLLGGVCVRIKKRPSKKDGLLLEKQMLRLGNFGFCGFNHFGEASRIVNSDFGEHFAVEVDARFRAAIDKSAVADAVHAACSIYTNDPEAAEAALLELSVHISHGLCAIDGFRSLTKEFAAGSTETLREFQTVVSSAA
jgi:hypothetical protein